MEEVSDLTEDFERDSVSEWHGGGCLDDWGVVLIGGKGVVFWGILCRFQWLGVCV